MMKRLLNVAGALAASALVLAPVAAVARAKIVINNQNGPGEGFNDPTPAVPVGGNPGTTVGEQRLLAFQFAASIWGATITSSQTITIDARFSALECSKDGIVLGSAGPEGQQAADPSFPDQTVWYSNALANAFANRDFDAQHGDIQANFNGNYGTTGCAAGSGWYYGLDGKAPANLSDLPTVLLHEFSHGLGFLTFSQSGHNQNNIPDIFEKYAYDNVVQKTWYEMTDAERQDSSLRLDQVVWSGANVAARAPTLLQLGTAFGITEPVGNAADFSYTPAEYGPKPTLGFGGEVARVQAADAGDATDACDAVTGVSGKIALADRIKPTTGQTTCTFKVKALNAQKAGAIGLIVIDYPKDTEPPGGLADDENVKDEITIPSMFVTNDSGVEILNAMQVGTTVISVHHTTTKPGMDNATNYPYLYTPVKFEEGSSVSHWSNGETVPSLLMEPYIHSDIPLGLDLTPSFMKDLGWVIGSDVTLAVAKSASVNAWPGGKAEYLITVLNHGSTDDTNVVVNAETPTGLTLESVSGAGCSSLPCTIGTVAADSRATVLATYSIPLDYTSPDPVVNHISFTSTQASAPDDAVVFTSPVQQAADMIVTADVPDSVEGGDQSIPVTITNKGPSVARNVSVQTNSETGVDFTGYSGDCTGTTCHFDTLQPGESKTVNMKINASGKTASFRVGTTSDTFDPYESNSEALVKFNVAEGGCTAPGGTSFFSLLLVAGAFALRRRKLRA